jgi:hypothetical protein
LRRPILLFAALVLLAAPGSGQSVRSRSADYLFAASANDVRALWTNPAGLGTLPNASVMAEFVLETPPDSSVQFAQWTLAFNSRGLSAGYQRDRFSEDPNTGALRLGLSLPFPRGSAGLAATYYHGSAVDTAGNYGLDLGVRYQVFHRIDLGLVARNIGRPTPRDLPLPFTGVLGANIAVVPRHLLVQTEVVAADRPVGSGYDLVYRGGVQIGFGQRLPVAAVGSVDLNSDFSATLWMVGFSIGGNDTATLGFSGRTGSGNTRLDRLSVTGVATRYITP